MAVPPPVVVVVVLVVIVVVIVVIGWGECPCRFVYTGFADLLTRGLGGNDLLTVRGNDLLTRASRDNDLLTFRGATIC